MKQGNTIVIDPVTRIEGHSKITLHLNEDGRVEELRRRVHQVDDEPDRAEGEDQEQRRPGRDDPHVGSRPDRDVWVLKCSNATYRVTRAPDMAAKVQPLP